jgi:hypothetical protein
MDSDMVMPAMPEAVAVGLVAMDSAQRMRAPLMLGVAATHLARPLLLMPVVAMNLACPPLLMSRARCSGAHGAPPFMGSADVSSPRALRPMGVSPLRPGRTMRRGVGGASAMRFAMRLRRRGGRKQQKNGRCDSQHLVVHGVSSLNSVLAGPHSARGRALPGNTDCQPEWFQPPRQPRWRGPG